MLKEKYNDIENIYLDTEQTLNNFTHESNNSSEISTRDTDIEEKNYESQEKEGDYEEIKNKLKNLDVKRYFKKEIYKQEETEEVEDENIYDYYEYDYRFFLDDSDPKFTEKLHARIFKDNINPMTPKNVDKKMKSLLGQFESLKQKVGISNEIYEILWDTVKKTVNFLKDCEIKSLDIDYYEDVFTEKDFSGKPLDLDDPFYPFYTFMKKFLNYEFKKKDFDELTTKNNLSDQPFISFLLDSFKTLTETYKDSINKKQKIVIDTTKDTKKEVTKKQKRVLNKLLFENIQSTRTIFNFSNCHHSFQSKLSEIDISINQCEKKIKILNTIRSSNKTDQNIKKDDSNNIESPEIWNLKINYEPNNKKHEKTCKEMVSNIIVKNNDKKAFDCIDLPVKKDKEQFSHEEYESEEYFYDDLEVLSKETTAIKDKHDDGSINNPYRHKPFNHLSGQVKQHVLIENTNQVNYTAYGITGMAGSSLLCSSDYIMMGFLLIMLAIYIGYIVNKTIQNRYKKQNIRYLRHQDEAVLLTEEDINLEGASSISKIEEEKNGRV